jgi:hypothetical protein
MKHFKGGRTLLKFGNLWFIRICMCVSVLNFLTLTVFRLKSRSLRSRPGQSMWDLWWTKWHWDRVYFEFFGFRLSIYRPAVALPTNIIRGMNSMSVIGGSSET